MIQEMHKVFRSSSLFGRACAVVSPLLLLTGCAFSGGMGFGDCTHVAQDMHSKVWTGGGVFGTDTLDTIDWPASANWKDSIEHWCVQYASTVENKTLEMHVLCGVETDLGASVEFDLERRKGEDGPALQVDRGFAFITFRWPLIWVRNIDAGSVGTTAIVRRHGDQIQLFLVRNAMQLGNQALTTDCDSGLQIDSGSLYPSELFEFNEPSTWEVIMVRHDKLAASKFYQPLGTGSGNAFKRSTWKFDVKADAATGQIEVSPEDMNESEAATFLAEVLAIARDNGLYIVPQDCPSANASPDLQLQSGS